MDFRGSYSSSPGYPPFYGQPAAPYQNPTGPGNIWTSSPALFSPQEGYYGGGPSHAGMSVQGGPPPPEYGAQRVPSPEGYTWEDDSYIPGAEEDTRPVRSASGSGPQASSQGKHQHRQRRAGNRDEFDGPTQFLPPPSPRTLVAQDRELPHLATNLFAHEQDDILGRVNACLSACAFNFVARYQFPIPVEPDKRPVRVPADREWTEWVHLLKRLATKRRVPARVLYNGQIKQLVTVLESSLEMRHAAAHQSRPLKDDRNVLQLVSAGLQVAKILKDAAAMELLDQLYVQTEDLIRSRKAQPPYLK